MVGCHTLKFLKKIKKVFYFLGGVNFFNFLGKIPCV